MTTLDRLRLGFASMAFAVVLYIPIAIFVYLFKNHPPDLSEAFTNYYFDLKTLAPEPGERAVFMATLILLPTGLLGVMVALKKRLSGVPLEHQRKWIHQWSKWAVGITIAIVVILIFRQESVETAYAFYGDRLGIVRNPGWTILLLVTLGMLTKWVTLHPKKGELLLQRAEWILFGLFLFSLFWFGFWGVGSLMARSDHFMVVYYPLTQVTQGGALLVDFVSQYGLYPFFLKPIFEVVGLSVGKFNFVLSLLNVVSYVMLFLLLRRWVQVTWIRILGWGAMTWFSMMSVKGLMSENSGNPIDPYFQYWPIRILFPIFGLWAAQRYLDRPTLSRYWSTLIVLSAGILWNLDSGLPAWGAWMLLLIYWDGIEKRDGTWVIKSLKHVGAGVVTVGLWLLIFGLVTLALRGEWPRFNLLFEYQKVFYLSGHYMLPMPLSGIWNGIALMYLIAIAIGVYHWVYKIRSTRATWIFTLGVMGAGLFSYFQGRSHPAVAATPSYPAFVLATLFIESLWKERKVLSVGWRVVSGASVGLFVILAISWVADAGLVIRSTGLAWKSFVSEEETVLAPSFEIVKKHTVPGESVLMLTDFSALFHGAAKTRAMAFDDYGQIYAVADYDRIENAILAKKATKVFLSANFASLGHAQERRKKIIDSVLANYQFLDQSTDRNLIVFVPKM